MHLPLPRWARARLGEPVSEKNRERAGLLARDAVFGVVDLETTGTSASSSILEIGLVVQRGGETLERFSSFVNPGTPVPWGITKLTGIEQSMIEDAPGPEDAVRAFARVLATHRVHALVAHNAPFDRRFLRRAWLESETPGELPGFMCSLRLARRLVRSPRYSLGVLVEYLSIPEHARHRALGDAEMTASLWWELLGRARLEGAHTLEAVARWAAPRASRKRRPRVHTVDVSRGIG